MTRRLWVNDDDGGELLKSLSPLLFSMKVFGLYFHREDAIRRRTGEPEWNPGAMKHSHGSPSTKLRVYATVILIVTWLNAIRSATMFTGADHVLLTSDHLGAVLHMKITLFTFSVLTAIIQTAYYYASHTGLLLKILLKLPVTRECIRRAHRAAIQLTIWIWISIVFDMFCGAFIYYNTEEAYNFLLSPFVTYISVQKGSIGVVKTFAYLGFMSLLMSVFFAHSMNMMLVYIFHNQFKHLKKNFRRSIGEKGEFNGDLSLFRRRHIMMMMTTMMMMNKFHLSSRHG